MPISAARVASHSLASTSQSLARNSVSLLRSTSPQNNGGGHYSAATDNALSGQCWEVREPEVAPMLQRPGLQQGSPDSSELQAQIRQMQSLLRSQQRQILEHQEALAELHDLITSQPVAGQQNGSVRPFEAQLAAARDRRSIGLYDARFHSTNWGATPKDHRVLPKRIILVRHAESEGNTDHFAYSHIPDPQICLTQNGHEQAIEAGQKIRAILEADGNPFKLYFYMSPYRRSSQTVEGIASCFTEAEIAGFQEEVQLREQDFGNFQDTEGKAREKAERLRFGRFFYRFPNGESGADVYDRMTIFEDHMIRDINAGRFSKNTSLVLVTHGLAARIFLMRWFHWSVAELLMVFNPPNAEPIVLERIPKNEPGSRASWIHTKALYRLRPESKDIIKGCSEEMCSTAAFLSGVKVTDWVDQD
ncbi:g5070 [Coccomyxa elongata]